MAGDLGARLAAVRGAVLEAAVHTGRDPAAVRIVAVTKTFPSATVREALDAGLTDIGENYVQEARAKRAAAGRRAVWHLIGGLQRNKVRAAVALFDRIHTVDSEALARTLDREAAHTGRPLRVLVQVNVAGGIGRRGVPPEGVESLAERVLDCAWLRLDGLMAVPPTPAVEDDSRPYFRLLREVRESAGKRLVVELPHLYMGMSGDFRVAVEEGATLLRLGRALFGARGPGASRPGGEGS